MMNLPIKAFGERVRAGRLKAGLTQAALGEVMGVSRGTIARWEALGEVPNAQTAYRLAAQLNTNLGYLIGAWDTPERLFYVPPAESAFLLAYRALPAPAQEMIRDNVESMTAALQPAAKV